MAPSGVPRLEAFEARIRALRESGIPSWGRMSAGQMICHLTDVLGVALGEVPVVRTGRFPLTLLAHYPVRWLFAYRLPWPKGMPTVPEMQRSKPAVFGDDVERLLAALRRFFDRRSQPDATWGVHPLLGPLPGWEWGPLVERHVDHHLRQFGV